MNGFNLSDIQDARLGGTQLSAIYLGSSKLWPTAIDYSREYLTIECLEDNTSLYFWTSSSKASTRTIQVSYDKSTWYTITTSYEAGSNGTLIDTLDDGDIIYIKGTENNYGNSSGYSGFKTLGTIKVYGNILSLLYGDNFIGQTAFPSTASYVFYRLFSNCSYLIDAQNLMLPSLTMKPNCYAYMFADCAQLRNVPILPATSLSSYCYQYMFKGCSSLTTLPFNMLPATTLVNSCYTAMFNDCTGLITVPYNLLPATTLANSCYKDMFRGCTSLKIAPDLNALTLAQGCYSYMFRNCSSLYFIRCAATNISATNSHSNWLSGVAEYGYFVRNEDMSGWPTGVNGKPDYWGDYGYDPEDYNPEDYPPDPNT